MGRAINCIHKEGFKALLCGCVCSLGLGYTKGVALFCLEINLATLACYVRFVDSLAQGLFRQ